MNLKTLLDEAKNSLAVLRHELLLSNGANALHCFFEGQTDESFYGTHIRSYLKAGQKMVGHCCGNKDSVYKAHADLLPKIKPPTLALFFVDKDLDDLIPIPRLADPAIYVTDTYSIENYLSNVLVIERAIGEIYRLGSGHTACAEMCKLYCTAYTQSSYFLSQLTAWILFHRRNGSRPNLNNINLDQICKISDDFAFSNNPLATVVPLLDIWTQVTTPGDYLTTYHAALESELGTYPREKIIRGKFVLWFVVLFLRVVKNKLVNHTPRRIINADISSKTALDLLGPRCALPASLSQYLDFHLGAK